MAKGTGKGSAQLEIGSPEWNAARAREAAEEKRRKEEQQAERERKEYEKRRAEAEAQRGMLHDIAMAARGDRDNDEEEERDKIIM